MLVLEKDDITQEIEKLKLKYGKDKSSLLPMLREVQNKYEYIPEFAQKEIARLLGIQPIEVVSMITFYPFLKTNPKGCNIVRLCQTLNCDLFGKKSVVKAIEKELGITFGETTIDGKFTLEHVNCLKMCKQGPVLLINERVYSKVTPEKAIQILNEASN